MKKKFTLVELIVIVAIIGVLTSLLISAMQNGIRKVKEIECVDNFKNIGAASIAYAGDNNGIFPVGRWHRSNELNDGSDPQSDHRDSTHYNAWRFQIGEYLYNTDYIEIGIIPGDVQDETTNAYNVKSNSPLVYQNATELWQGPMSCPLADTFDNGLGVTYESLYNDNTPDYYRTGYGFSQGFCEFKDSPITNKEDAISTPLRTAKVEIPGDTVMAGDTFFSGAAATQSGNAFLRLIPYVAYMRNNSASYNAHGQGANVLWADGRAGFVEEDLLMSQGPNDNDENYYFDPDKR